MKIKSFDRREELMEAALTEFIAKSYEEASLNTIIKNAGISKGTFYYHFADKQALYLSVLRSHVDAKINFLESKMQDYSRDENRNVFENFKLQARLGIEFARAYPKYYLFGMMFLREKGNKIYDTAMEMLNDTSERYFEEMLEHAIRRGDLRSGVSAGFANKIITYLFTRYDEIFDIKESDFNFDLILKDLDSLIDFMQYGLGSGHPSK